MTDNAATSPEADKAAAANSDSSASADSAAPAAPAQADTTAAPVPPPGAAQAAQPSAEFMAKVDAMLSGSAKVANPASEWILGQIKTAIGEQQQAQQQLQQLLAAQQQAKTAADIGQGKVAALLPVLERSEADAPASA